MPQAMRRNTFIDYKTRLSNHHSVADDDKDMIQGLRIPWTSDIISRDGAHYHCWISRSLDEQSQKALKHMFIRAAYYQGDPVMFSWDYIPLEVEQ